MLSPFILFCPLLILLCSEQQIRVVQRFLDSRKAQEWRHGKERRQPVPEEERLRDRRRRRRPRGGELRERRRGEAAGGGGGVHGAGRPGPAAVREGARQGLRPRPPLHRERRQRHWLVQSFCLRSGCTHAIFLPAFFLKEINVCASLPGTIIKRQAHNNFAGLFYGLSFTKLNKDFTKTVRSKFSPESKLLVVCQEGLR